MTRRAQRRDDSRDAVREQVKTYHARDGTRRRLSLNLVDSAYIAWDLARRCRRFNAALGCRWLDEIACFSDRDQLSFPRRASARATAPPADGAGRAPPALRPAGARVNIIPAAGAANDASPLRHWYYSRSVAVLPTTRTERTPAEAAIARSKELARARAAARKRSMEREWRANAHQEWRAQQKTAAHEWRVQQQMLRKAEEARADGDNDQAEIVEQEVTMERVWVRKRRVKKKKKKMDSRCRLRGRPLFAGLLRARAAPAAGWRPAVGAGRAAPPRRRRHRGGTESGEPRAAAAAAPGIRRS